MIRSILFVVGIVLFIAACSGQGAQALSAADYAAAFEAAGLEVANSRDMTAEDWGAAPQTGQGIRFGVPATCDCGVRVIVSEDQAALDALAEYYIGLGEANALFRSWVYTRPGAVVQMNGEIPEEVAAQYQATFEGVE